MKFSSFAINGVGESPMVGGGAWGQLSTLVLRLAW